MVARNYAIRKFAADIPMDKFITAGLILLLTGSILLKAQEPQAFSLKEARQYAVENSMSSKASAIEMRTYKQRALELVSAGFPDIYSEVLYQNNFKLATSLIPRTFIDANAAEDEFFEVSFGTKHNANLTFGVNQPLIDGRYFVGLAARKTLLEFSGIQHDKNVHNVNYVISDAYYTALVATENLRILEESAKSVEKTLSDTRVMYENGFSEALDVDRLQLSFSTIQTDLQAAQRQADLAKFVLKYQMGFPLDEEIELTEEVNKMIEPETLSILTTEFDPTQRIEHKMLTMSVQLKELDKKQRKAAFFPSLASFATYDFSAQRSEFNLFDFDQPWFKSGMWGLQLKVPIFDGFKAGSALQKTNLELLERKHLLESFERDSRLQAITAQSNYNNALQKVKNEQANIELAEKIYNKSITKYQEGVGSSVELAAAERDMISAKGRYINALYELLTSKNEVDQALGQLD